MPSWRRANVQTPIQHLRWWDSPEYYRVIGFLSSLPGAIYQFFEPPAAAAAAAPLLRLCVSNHSNTAGKLGATTLP
jgi:hypothetical protein